MNNDPSPPLKTLVVDGLGYCCLWAFFSLFEHLTGQMIADRLGCTPPTVSKWRTLYDRDELRCTNCEKCALSRVRKKLAELRRG